MQLTEERKKRIIDLYFNQHNTYAEIAQIEKISPRDIHTIIKEELARRQKHKQEEQSAEAYKLFSEGKTTVQVATMLNLSASMVIKLYIDYLKLRGVDKLNTIYKETNGKLWPFLKLYKELIKKRGMSIAQVAKVVEIAIHKLPYMESLHRQIKEEVNKLQYTRQSLINDIEDRKYKISILDKIAFSCEQQCRRKHQEIQELTDKKGRLERLIANILNGEGYSKLKLIVRENIKAILSDNKIVISTAFAALVQTLQNDPEMIKAIYNISIANDYKDNKNNNIANYFKANKDRILNLAEKNYENLVEALTDSTINTGVAYSSSNPTSSLRSSSSSTFRNLSNQNDTYRRFNKSS